MSFSYQVTDGSDVGGRQRHARHHAGERCAVVTGAVTLAAIAEDSGARLITQAQLLGNVTDVDGPSLTATGFAIATGSGSLVDNNNGTWSYTPALNDDTSVSFSYLVTDGTTSVADSATLDITPVNDAPVNNLPASLNIAANTNVAIAGLDVSDVDATSLTTTLHVEHGTLNVGAVGGATVAGSGSSTVTLTGSVAQIDAALGAANNVLYHGAFDFSGIDHLTMTSNDGSLSDTDVLNLACSSRSQRWKPSAHHQTGAHAGFDGAHHSGRCDRIRGRLRQQAAVCRRTGRDTVSTGRRARFPSGVSPGSAAEIRGR